MLKIENTIILEVEKNTLGMINILETHLKDTKVIN
jgi:ribosomal protein L30/L7E